MANSGPDSKSLQQHDLVDRRRAKAKESRRQGRAGIIKGMSIFVYVAGFTMFH